MVGHRNDKEIVLSEGLAGEDGGRVAAPIMGIGQTPYLNAVSAAVAQVALQQVALIPHHDAQTGKAGLDKGFNGVVNQWSSQHRYQRFGVLSRQSLQACAGPCGKNYTFHPSSLSKWPET